MKAPRPAVKNADRRNECPHPDAVAAVDLGPCTCGSAAQVRCLNKAGKLTNHVHAARMSALDAFRADLAAGATRKAPASQGALKAAASRPARATRKAAK